MKKIIATICHNEDDRHNPNARRVSLWLEDGAIWAKGPGEEPYDTEVSHDIEDINDAVDIITACWDAGIWDLQFK